MNKKTYHYEPDGPLGIVGYFVQCSKCGKKSIVEAAINGTNHNANVSVTCLDCFKISEKFRLQFPDKSKEIDEKMGAFKNDLE
jgi:hypothetical protein